MEKGLGSATTKRNKLRDDLEAARQKAAETAAALDEVNARLDAGRKSKFGVTSKGDETLSDKLAAKLQQQDTAVQAAADCLPRTGCRRAGTAATARRTDCPACTGEG